MTTVSLPRPDKLVPEIKDLRSRHDGITAQIEPLKARITEADRALATGSSSDRLGSAERARIAQELRPLYEELADVGRALADATRNAAFLGGRELRLQADYRAQLNALALKKAQLYEEQAAVFITQNAAGAGGSIIVSSDELPLDWLQELRVFRSWCRGLGDLLDVTKLPPACRDLIEKARPL